MQSTQSYSRTQIGLHWAIAGLILLNYVLSEGMEDAFDATMEGKVVAFGITPNLHVWVGVAVLGLVVVRFAVRLVQGAPAPMGTAFADKVATVGHWALYALMFAAPVLGEVSWFGGIDATAEWHVLVVNMLMILALAHAVVALVHQFLLRDGTMLRMMRASAPK